MTEGKRLTVADRRTVRDGINAIGDYVETLREQSAEVRGRTDRFLHRLALEHKANALERTAAELNEMLYRIPLSADERQESER